MQFSFLLSFYMALKVFVFFFLFSFVSFEDITLC